METAIEKKSYTISVHLDKRRIKKNGTYPVTLRLYISEPTKKRKYYPTKFEFTEKEFHNIWISKKVRQEDRPIKSELQDLEKFAYDIADNITPFNIPDFERMILRQSADFDNIYLEYEKTINKFKDQEKISTSETYDLSLRSIKAFIKETKGQIPTKISFKEITPLFLQQYENYMVQNNRSLTTVSIYLRALRAVFNNAITDKIVDQAYYPFGKKKYEVPSPKGVKKALSKEQLSILFHAIPETPDQQKAKDFFFFSYTCNGMNFKDIAYLKFKNYNSETINFYREKTKSTHRDQSAVTIYVNDFIKETIKKYSISDTMPDNYIFDIVDHKSTPEEQHKQLKNFIRFVNQHFSKFAKKNGIMEKVSTYWARHSFATNAIRSGASMEFVSEALSHSNLSTTQNYFAGFADDAKKDIANKLMDL
jgi:site-specific recombinase XerD